MHHDGRLTGALDYYDLEAAYFQPLLNLLHHMLRRHPQLDRLQLGQLREPRDPATRRSHHAVPRARPPRRDEGEYGLPRQEDLRGGDLEEAGVAQAVDRLLLLLLLLLGLGACFH